MAGASVIARNIRARMAALGLNQKSLARKAEGLNETYVRDILAGRSKNPKAGHLSKLATALEWTVDDLYRDDPPEQHLGNMPDMPESAMQLGEHVEIVKPELRPGMGGGAYQDIADATKVLFPRRLVVDQLGARPDDLWLVEVEGPSMEPILESGDQVLVNTAKKNPSQPGIFCLWDGFGIVCKLVERVARSDPPRIRVVSANATFQPYELTEEEAYIIGRVVWFARRL